MVGRFSRKTQAKQVDDSHVLLATTSQAQQPHPLYPGARKENLSFLHGGL